MIEFNNLLVLLLLIWLAGKLFRYLQLPVLFGELLVGILIGPKILGLVGQTEMIKLMAEFGIFFLMLHEGLTNDPREIFKATKKSYLIGVLATIFPFLIGVFTGYLLDLNWLQSGIIGSFFGITAVTVSTRILKDYKISNPKLSNVIFTAGLISDILAIVLISIMFDINSNGFSWYGILKHLFLVSSFFAFTLWFGQRFFGFISRYFYKGNKAFTFTLILAVFMAFIAEQIGVKPAIGAFLAGLFIREEVLTQELYDKIEDRIYGLSYSFLAPIFFVSIAFLIDLTVFLKYPLILLVFVISSFTSKFLSTYLASLYSGLDEFESKFVAFAMNSRGAIEIILLSLAESEGLISKQTFSLLIATSFITTFISIIFMKPMVKKMQSRNDKLEIKN